MKIVRRLFVVPVADNDHGKTSMIKALVSQGDARQHQKIFKGRRTLVSPWGREIDAYIFGRSYQEVEKGDYKSVIKALNANDPNWRDRELIIMPSHVSDSGNDIEKMIEAAHEGGFDAICVSILFTGTNAEDRSIFSKVWNHNWDERWTIPNPRFQDTTDDDLKAQLRALGCDLWSWICRTLTP